MIDVESLLPKSYMHSRNFKAIVKLMDILINVQKADIDNFVDLLNPLKCPNNILPLLASYVGYKYDPDELYSTNRLIIKYYPLLIRNRGSLTGVTLAVALAINASANFTELELTNMFSIGYDHATNVITVYMYYTNPISKLHDLIEVVRPAGTKCIIVPSQPISTAEKLQISDLFTYNTEVYSTSDRFSITNNNRVGFGEVAKNNNG